MTGMYNVLKKLRSGEALNDKEKKIHEQGLVSVLKQIHDDLDAAVFDAYGWPHDLTDEQILERLVALNAERSRRSVMVSCGGCDPNFRIQEAPVEETQTALPGTETPEEEAAAAPVARAWPKKLPEQVAVVRDLLLTGRAWGVEQVAKVFKGARRREVVSKADPPDRQGFQSLAPSSGLRGPEPNLKGSHHRLGGGGEGASELVPGLLQIDIDHGFRRRHGQAGRLERRQETRLDDQYGDANRYRKALHGPGGRHHPAALVS
jgi:hypothetical protein